MQVFVAMINDRHSNPEPYVFSTADAAIDFARDEALSRASRPGDFEERAIGGWLYHATYSGEGDSVWVVEKNLDGNEVL